MYHYVLLPVHSKADEQVKWNGEKWRIELETQNVEWNGDSLPVPLLGLQHFSIDLYRRANPISESMITLSSWL